MLQEPAQKLFVSQRHGARLAVMLVVLPTEGDFMIGHVELPVIGDRNPMRVAGQVMQNMFRSAKGPLGVNDPVLAKQCAHKGIEVSLSG